MIHFMCQVGWATECPDIWLLIILGCLGGCFWVRLTLESIDGGKQSALLSVGCPHPLHFGPEKNKRWNSLSLSFCLTEFKLGHPSSAMGSGGNDTSDLLGPQLAECKS